MEKLLEKQDRLQYPNTQVKEKERCLLTSSGEVPDDLGGRSEDTRDSYNNYKTQAGSSKTEKPYKSERYFSSRRNSSDSFCRNSEDKMKASSSRRFEKDTEGRKDHSRRWEPGSVKYSTSPASSDYSWKSLEKHKKYTSGSRDSRPEQRYQFSTNQGERAYVKEDSCGEGNKTEAPEDTLNSKEQPESRIKKNLPQNLLNIFNQIAEFEKEKGNKPRK